MQLASVKTEMRRPESTEAISGFGFSHGGDKYFPAIHGRIEDRAA